MQVRKRETSVKGRKQGQKKTCKREIKGQRVSAAGLKKHEVE